MEDERIGLNMAEHSASTALLDLASEMEGQRSRGDFSRHVSVEPHTEVGQIAVEYNRVLDTINTESQLREQAIVALHANKENTRMIIDHALDAIVIVDAQGRITIGTPTRIKRSDGRSLRCWAGRRRRRLFLPHIVVSTKRD